MNSSSTESSLDEHRPRNAHLWLEFLEICSKKWHWRFIQPRHRRGYCSRRSQDLLRSNFRCAVHKIYNVIFFNVILLIISAVLRSTFLAYGSLCRPLYSTACLASSSYQSVSNLVDCFLPTMFVLLRFKSNWSHFRLCQPSELLTLWYIVANVTCQTPSSLCTLHPPFLSLHLPVPLLLSPSPAVKSVHSEQ